MHVKWRDNVKQLSNFRVACYAPRHHPQSTARGECVRARHTHTHTHTPQTCFHERGKRHARSRAHARTHTRARAHTHTHTPPTHAHAHKPTKENTGREKGRRACPGCDYRLVRTFVYLLVRWLAATERRAFSLGGLVGRLLKQSQIDACVWLRVHVHQREHSRARHQMCM